MLENRSGLCHCEQNKRIKEHNKRIKERKVSVFVSTHKVYTMNKSHSALILVMILRER